jgi:hypothetical protein
VLLLFGRVVSAHIMREEELNNKVQECNAKLNTMNITDPCFRLISELRDALVQEWIQLVNDKVLMKRINMGSAVKDLNWAINKALAGYKITCKEAPETYFCMLDGKLKSVRKSTQHTAIYLWLTQELLTSTSWEVYEESEPVGTFKWAKQQPKGTYFWCDQYMYHWFYTFKDGNLQAFDTLSGERVECDPVQFATGWEVCRFEGAPSMPVVGSRFWAQIIAKYLDQAVYLDNPVTNLNFYAYSEGRYWYYSDGNKRASINEKDLYIVTGPYSTGWARFPADLFREILAKRYEHEDVMNKLMDKHRDVMNKLMEALKAY